ncbi:MAG TPA: DUF3616 domain-containing protein [Methylophilaceae bacterium]|nr:DUF3616 domain-containing protein [Methylophilaceae bacterium]
MKPTSTVLLEFNPQRDNLGKGKELRDGLSVALQIGDTLWVANDESISLERLSLQKESKSGNYKYGREHKQFCLSDYLELPVPPAKLTKKQKKTKPEESGFEEIDIEGLDYEGGYLWLVGSHSLKRSKPDLKDGQKIAQKQLAEVSADGNRYLLARIPVVDVDGTYTLTKVDKHKGQKRSAALLDGNAKGNDLTEALRQDKHLGPFLDIPGKDNGFDVEGLALVGKRILLGLRGPVLRGWAVILELELKQDKKQPSRLKLKAIGPKQRLYRKHFLDLGGLGIRDICVQDSDLLILAGPTMSLDGPVTIFRWPGGAEAKSTGIKNESVVTAETLQHVMDVPYGKGVDHAEGITLFSQMNGKASSLLVVYDSASESRQLSESSAVADVFSLR